MNPFSMFQPSVVRRNLKIMAVVARWLMLLFSGSIEIFLRNNFGERYFLTLGLAFVFGAFCFTLIPSKSILTPLFIFGQIALIFWHAVYAFDRQISPHSRSSGDSWPQWQRLGLPSWVVRCIGEPMLCVVTGLLVRLVDEPLGIWLEISGFALFVKELLIKIRFTWRIFDAADAKQDAQQLNSGLSNYTKPASPGTQRPHRAQLPHHMRQP